MKRFRFRLQKYLDLKEQEEMLARLELIRARTAYRLEVSKLEAIQAKTGELLAQSRELLCGSIRPELLNLISGCLQVQEKLTVEQASAVARAEENLNREQQSFLRARQGRKLLDRLRQYRWAAYYAESLREEQRNLDEIGAILFTRS